MLLPVADTCKDPCLPHRSLQLAWQTIVLHACMVANQHCAVVLPALHRLY